MNRLRVTWLAVLSGLVLSGCSLQLQEIRSKSKFGPEFRHNGLSRTNAVRWYAQQGFEFQWDKDIRTGITYRRRDTDNGGGDNDNGVWIDFSFPIWKANKKPDVTIRRIEELERRLAELETERTRQRQEHAAGPSSDTMTSRNH